MNDVLSYLDSADILLGTLPSRKQLTGIPEAGASHTVRIRVNRTMPFEFVANLMPPFSGLWGAGVRFDFSDYDAALSGLGEARDADLHIFWMDWRIYSGSMAASDCASWLKERISRLREVTDKPIWVNNWAESGGEGECLYSDRASDRGWFRSLNAALSELAFGEPGIELIDLALLAQEDASSFYDDRNDAIAGYPFSDRTTIRIARHLGVHLLPASRNPRLKAIALDLDDTLYGGVLGEDGAAGVRLTEGHRRLQKSLLRLKQSGIMLTICSRNEAKDVEDLFEARDDFPLRLKDFSVIKADWQPKAGNLNELARQLNIDCSAMLFVDDNSVELLKAAESLPELHLLRASRDDAFETLRKLLHYPGLYQLRRDSEARNRTADIQAGASRERLRRESSDFNSYLAGLKMVVRLHVNEMAHADRLYDLSRKTNQFNLALRRLTQEEARAAFRREEHLTVTVGLRDKLADSGIVGAFVIRLKGEEAQLIETLFSCRALGRDVETLSFAHVLEMLANRGVKRLRIDARTGPRNAPSLEWLGRFADAPGEDCPLPDLRSRVAAACGNHPAQVEVAT
ncbi:HAD-IIIC family phosphatase [Cohnella thailandensis]|uniref:HAD-IIIC family phosphatase n=1 Tax=Cohnella thailandensis TaxID=557557 RepID=A0A841SU55_9BACL|nr:HAD-IIIC family phosphatase [Cohnella thailandensis]MBB6635853.1 HAD-IIIC family phosphatase [Cohnella thailandensis]MBP1976231.1 FkbH-like protein [Cohnella thailandensis]